VATLDGTSNDTTALNGNWNDIVISVTCRVRSFHACILFLVWTKVGACLGWNMGEPVTEYDDDDLEAEMKRLNHKVSKAGWQPVHGLVAKGQCRLDEE